MNSEYKHNKKNQLVVELVLVLRIIVHSNKVFQKINIYKKRKVTKQKNDPNKTVYEYIYKLTRNLKGKVRLLIKLNIVGFVLKVKVEPIEHLNEKNNQIYRWLQRKLAIKELQHRILELFLKKDYFAKSISSTL